MKKRHTYFIKHTFLCSIFCILILMILPAVQTEADDAAERIPRLIENLGHADFKVREAAVRELWKIGRPTLDALKKEARGDDPEVKNRARLLVQKIRLGIQPSWPREVVERIQRHDKLPDPQKKRLADTLVEKYGKNALAFLLMQIRKTNNDVAEYALSKISGLNESRDLSEELIRRIGTPDTDYEQRLLFDVYEKCRDIPGMIRVLGKDQPDRAMKSRLVKAAIDELCLDLKRFAFEDVMKTAEDLSAIVPDEARFLYLQAIAAGEIGEDQMAEELKKRALTLNPYLESPHYTTADLLENLGMTDEAEQEWKKILTAPPTGGVYDINAYIRLGNIYSERKEFSKAADSFQSALDFYEAEKKKGQGGMGVVGGSIDQLRKAVKGLRKQAETASPRESEPIKEKPVPLHLRISMEVRLKEQFTDQLCKQIQDVKGTARISIQPRGFRLFENKGAEIKYVKDIPALVVLLNGTTCAQPFPFKVKGKQTLVGIQSLDMCYIYNVQAASEKTKRVASMEKDYVLRICPCPRMGKWMKPEITLNSKTYTWKELRKGLEFDYFPEKFNVEVSAENPAGDKKYFETRFDGDQLDPDLEEIKGRVMVGVVLNFGDSEKRIEKAD